MAVKVSDGGLFRMHVDRVRKLYLEGKLKTCKGWQVYQSFTGLAPDTIGDNFVFIEDNSRDFNSPEDLINPHQ